MLLEPWCLVGKLIAKLQGGFGEQVWQSSLKIVAALIMHSSFYCWCLYVFHGVTYQYFVLSHSTCTHDVSGVNFHLWTLGILTKEKKILGPTCHSYAWKTSFLEELNYQDKSHSWWQLVRTSGDSRPWPIRNSTATIHRTWCHRKALPLIFIAPSWLPSDLQME